MNVIDENLSSKDNITINTESNGLSYLTSANFYYKLMNYKDESLQYCIAAKVTNRGVALSGESSSYTSPLTGIRYSKRDTHERSGGDVISFVSKDGKEILAQGNKKYVAKGSLGSIDDVTVRYQLEAKIQNDDLEMHFNSLERAWNNTSAENLGFRKIGAWEAAGGIYAYNTIESISQDIYQCISSR